MGYTLALLKAHWSKVRAPTGQEESSRIDRDLPLGISIGATVSLSQTPFLLAGADMIMAYPGSEFTVAAYGVIPVEDLIVHRFYLIPKEGAREHDLFLQVTCQLDGKIGDILLLEESDIIEPQTVHDWNEWLDCENGMIGQLYFRTPTEYVRSWKSKNPERMQLVTMRERIYPDPWGADSTKLVQDVMQYGRTFLDNRQKRYRSICSSRAKNAMDEFAFFWELRIARNGLLWCRAETPRFLFFFCIYRFEELPMGFFSSFLKIKGYSAKSTLEQLLVEFDPQTASEAAIAHIEERFDELNKDVVKARRDYQEERRQAVETQEAYDDMVAAAEILYTQYEAEMDATRKVGLGASLKKHLDVTESCKADRDREEQEAVDAKTYLDELEAMLGEVAARLKTARSRHQTAIKDMKRAQVVEQRAAEQAERSAKLAGLRTQQGGQDVALDAMQRVAQMSKDNAEASRQKAKMLGDVESTVDGDSNVTAALEAAKRQRIGTTAPSTNFSDRLAALKKQQG